MPAFTRMDAGRPTAGTARRGVKRVAPPWVGGNEKQDYTHIKTHSSSALLVLHDAKGTGQPGE